MDMATSVRDVRLGSGFLPVLQDNLRKCGDYLLDAWEESPFYSDRERAALAWCETVTCITEGHVPDEAYEKVRTQFSEKELVNLTLAIVSINGANRLNIAFRTVPGSYRVQRAS